MSNLTSLSENRTSALGNKTIGKPFLLPHNPIFAGFIPNQSPIAHPVVANRAHFAIVVMEECRVAAQIRVKCEPTCVGFKKALDACATRIETLKEKHPEANCELQYFDLQACVDKCVAPKLFQKLK